MASNTSEGGRVRARRTTAVDTEFSCPTCGGGLRRSHGSLECANCGHVPRHGAD